MGTIVTGFVDSPEGDEAFDLAVAETKKRNGMLVVAHSMRCGTATSIDEIARYDLASLRSLDGRSRNWLHRQTTAGGDHSRRPL